MTSIDINCDLGEGFGNDAELMKFISSANIACGYHAGDADTMRRTIALALENGVAIGAHPGYADVENFGRTAMSLAPDEVTEIVTQQIGALLEICNSLGVRLNHVKPHGALYNQAANDPELARAIATAVRSVDPQLIFYGLSGSVMISEADALGLATASEVFADRTYQPDGTLTPRSQPNALIESTNAAIEQVLQMIQSATVTATSGEVIPIKAETICIHGDGEHAVDFARALSHTLKENQITIGRR